MITPNRKIFFGWLICSILNAALCGLTDKSTLCRLKSEVSHDEALSINENKLPKTHEGKCYYTCLLQESKIMENDQIVPEAAFALVDSEKQMTKLQKRRLAFKLKKCAGAANVEKDECESAFKFMECTRDETECLPDENKTPQSGRKTISIRLPEMINLMIPPLSLPPINLVLFMLG